MEIAYLILLREFALIPESDKALHVVRASQVVLVIQIVPARAGDAGDLGSVLRLGRWAWQPAPVFLPGESRRQRNLTGYSPWGHREADTTEATFAALSIT